MIKAVHLFNFKKGSRYTSMISQGLFFHPEIEVSFNTPFISLGKILKDRDPDIYSSLIEADYIFRPEDSHFGIKDFDSFLDKNDLWKNVICYDFRDEPYINKIRKRQCLAYIKRSWTAGAERKLLHTIDSGVFPMDFGLLDEYFAVPFPEKKDIDFACLFPMNPVIGERRYRLVKEMLPLKKQYPTSIIGKGTAGAQVGRRAIFEPPENNPMLAYLSVLKRAKIVFTAFPDYQDGDSRTWEAFSSKALVFMDITHIPSPWPLKYGKHCFIYDARDSGAIRDAVALARYYLKNEEARNSIAMSGYKYALDHHKPVDRINSVLKWAASANRNLDRHVIFIQQAPVKEHPVEYGFPEIVSDKNTRLPDFLGIGAQKAGTTWIYHNLRIHEQIFMPKEKEIHFFDRAYTRGLKWYLSLFRGAGKRICGEITPAYSILEKAEIEQVSRIFPDLKIFLILRNPIERAWSAAKMDISRIGGKYGKIPEDVFATYLSYPVSVAKSDYKRIIQNWREYIPRDKFLILFYDELKKDPESFIKKIFEFLNVDSDIDKEKFQIDKVLFKGSETEFTPRLREMAVDIYGERIRGLEDYLERDLTGWKKPYGIE